MNSGYLYFDGNPRKAFICKVAKAAFYFKRKYGRMPEVCIVNPVDVEKLPIEPPDKMLTGCIGVCLGDQPVKPVPAVESLTDMFIWHAQKKTAEAK